MAQQDPQFRGNRLHLLRLLRSGLQHAVQLVSRSGQRARVGAVNTHGPQGAGKACGVSTPSWTSMGRTPGYIPRDPHFMATKGLLFALPCAECVAVQSPGKSVLTADHPSQLAISSPSPKHPWCPNLPRQGTPGLGTFGHRDIRFLVQSSAQQLSGCGLT